MFLLPGCLAESLNNNGGICGLFYVKVIYFVITDFLEEILAIQMTIVVKPGPGTILCVLSNEHQSWSLEQV